MPARKQWIVSSGVINMSMVDITPHRRVPRPPFCCQVCEHLYRNQIEWETGRDEHCTPKAVVMVWTTVAFVVYVGLKHLCSNYTSVKPDDATSSQPMAADSWPATFWCWLHGSGGQLILGLTRSTVIGSEELNVWPLSTCFTDRIWPL